MHLLFPGLAPSPDWDHQPHGTNNTVKVIGCDQGKKRVRLVFSLPLSPTPLCHISIQSGLLEQQGPKQCHPARQFCKPPIVLLFASRLSVCIHLLPLVLYCQHLGQGLWFCYVSIQHNGVLSPDWGPLALPQYIQEIIVIISAMGTELLGGAHSC